MVIDLHAQAATEAGRQPFFDADGYLFCNNLKLNWSDWTGHPNRMSTLELHNILRPMLEGGDISRFSIFAFDPIMDSSDNVVHHIDSPSDQHEWQGGKHPMKPQMTFNGSVFRETKCLIGLPDFNGFDDCERRFRWHEKLFDSAQL